jgi:hypothetical protein
MYISISIHKCISIKVFITGGEGARGAHGSMPEASRAA